MELLFTNNLFFLRTVCPYGTFGFIKKSIAKSLNHFLLKSNVFETLKINNILIELRYIVFLSDRSEEHTSELQSRPHLVCRLLLEKKKKKKKTQLTSYTKKKN